MSFSGNWQTDVGVTTVTRPEGRRLHPNLRNINEVTGVTAVTTEKEENDTERASTASGSEQAHTQDEQCFAGNAGNKGYNADSIGQNNVTKPQTSLVTPVTNCPDSVLSPENSWEWIVERVAILEFDGGLDRATADHCAFLIWYGNFIDPQKKRFD